MLAEQPLILVSCIQILGLAGSSRRLYWKEKGYGTVQGLGPYKAAPKRAGREQ